MYYSRFEEVEYKAESDAGVFWSIPDVVGDSGTYYCTISTDCSRGVTGDSREQYCAGFKPSCDP
jgi:hypothetical protein